jgi:hypothetical protein
VLPTAIPPLEVPSVGIFTAGAAGKRFESRGVNIVDSVLDGKKEMVFIYAHHCPDAEAVNGIFGAKKKRREK